MTENFRYAVVLTAPSERGVLTDRIVASVRSLLDRASITGERWLKRGDAWALHFTAARADNQAALREQIASTLRSYPIDVNVVPDDGAFRRKRLLVADMESTIIEQECLDELADYVGQRPAIAAITKRAMRGEIAFEDALAERVALLAGLDVNVLDQIYTRRVTLMPGAQTLVSTLRRHACHCALVSGGFTYFTERVAARLGFDTHQANTLEIADGKLAGSVRLPILGREAKLAALQRLTRDLNISRAQTMAVGDGANDLAMIGAAGLGVAFRAKPIVAENAPVKIDHGDLTALLYLQGYAASEFAS